MSKKNTQESQPVNIQADEQTQEQVFPINILRRDSFKLFHCTRSTFDGATYGMKNGDYTISEIKETIKSWLKKEAH